MKEIVIRFTIRSSEPTNEGAITKEEICEAFWNDLIVTSDFLEEPAALRTSLPQGLPRPTYEENNISCDWDSKFSKCIPVSTVSVDGPTFAQFVTLLTLSKRLRTEFLLRVYRNIKSSGNSIIEEHLCLFCKIKTVPILLRVILQWPSKLMLDYNWSYKMDELVNRHCELDNLSAWLSTLGGGFSSLGENSLHFAERAQLTSLQQLAIARRLSNPLLESRCRLYFAVSLLQKGQLRRARRILEKEFEFAKSAEAKADQRLFKMCLGIWAKLKYLHQQHHLSALQ